MQDQALNLIKEIFQERHRKNPGYSLRAFARDAGVSASQISRLLNGTRKLTEEQFDVIANHLRISTALRNECTSETMRGRILAGTKAVKIETFKSISEWQHWAILNLTYLEDFQPTPGWIAKRLGISVHLAKESIARLLELNLLQRQEKGLVKTGPNLIVQPRRSEDAIRIYHQQMMDKASEYLKDPSENARSKRKFTGQTFAVSESGLKRIQKKLSELQKEVSKAVAQGPRTEIYQLNLQLFPLTKKLKKSGEKK